MKVRRVMCVIDGQLFSKLTTAPSDVIINKTYTRSSSTREADLSPFNVDPIRLACNRQPTEPTDVPSHLFVTSQDRAQRRDDTWRMMSTR